jgi:hypothetical protein
VSHRLPKRENRPLIVDRRAAVAVLFAAWLAACSAPLPPPRTYLDFMEDGLAREGVLARCSRDGDTTVNDAECAAARRAAAAIAVEHERAQSAELERESQRKLLAMRARADRADEVRAEAAAAAREAAERAYEGRWPEEAPEGGASAEQQGDAPAFGAPIGPVLPSISESSPFEVYSGTPVAPGIAPQRPEPPSNEVAITAPDVGLAGLTAVPRPLKVEPTEVAN